MRQALMVLCLLAVPALGQVQQEPLHQDTEIPHLAQGHGWSTTIRVSNLCDTQENYLVLFFNQEGKVQNFLFEHDGEKYLGIKDDIAPRAMQTFILPDAGQRLTQGTGDIRDDGDGCVSFEIEYVQTRADGEQLKATIPVSRRGAVEKMVVTLANRDRPNTCSTGLAIAGTGNTVKVTLLTKGGQYSQHWELRNVYHEAFNIYEEFYGLKQYYIPSPRYVALEIKGATSAVALDFCDGRLQQFRLPHTRWQE